MVCLQDEGYNMAESPLDGEGGEMIMKEEELSPASPGPSTKQVKTETVSKLVLFIVRGTISPSPSLSSLYCIYDGQRMKCLICRTMS